MANYSNAAKAFIVNKDNCLLLLKRRPNDVQKPGIWELPGGRLNAGENPWEGVKREALEETGLEIEPLIPFSVRHFTRDDGQIITLIIFLARPLTDEIKLSAEHTEFEWVPIEEAREKINPWFLKEVDLYERLNLQTQINFNEENEGCS